MEYYRSLEDFHLHIMQSSCANQDYQTSLSRYEETCLVLDQTLACETNSDFRCKLNSLRRSLKIAAQALSKARGALVQIAAIEAGSGVNRYGSRVKTGRTIPFDGFILRLQIYDGVSKMYQIYIYRKLEEVRDVTSGLLKRLRQ